MVVVEEHSVSEYGTGILQRSEQDTLFCRFRMARMNHYNFNIKTKINEKERHHTIATNISNKLVGWNGDNKL